MAILAVILPVGDGAANPKSERKRNVGCYVIHPRAESGYYFSLYDRKKEFLAKSSAVFAHMCDAKYEIGVCRTLGTAAGLEDTTQRWIKEVEHPRFELLRAGNTYFFRLCASDEKVLFESNRFDDNKLCIQTMKRAMEAVGSEDIYLDSEFEDEHEATVVAAAPVIEEKVAEPVEAKPEAPVEEPVETAIPEPVEVPETISMPGPEDGIEVVGVIWPEDFGRSNLIYYYDPSGEILHEGDRVLVPTRDSERIADIAKPNHRVPKDFISVPLKKIIRVIKRIK